MKWEVRGADRQSGAEYVEIIDADNEEQAKRRANRLGLLVESLRPLDPNDSVARDQSTAASQPVAVYLVPSSAPSQIVLTERTSKEWKGQIVAAFCLCVLSFVACILGCAGISPFPTAIIGVILLVGGFSWLVTAIALAWWFHG
jgi:hypothetical protein